MYAGSSLGREIIGTKETVRATTSEHLRKYMGEWYYGGNMLVVVAGKVGDKKEVIEQIEAKLGSVKQGGIMDYVSAGGYGKAEARHYKKKTEQAHFYMGVPAISMHDPRRYALQLSQVVLGGGMSSRLFNEIREKRGLAYYVKADIDMTYDTGYLAVRAGVKLSQLAEALKVVKEEMLKLGGTITEAELTKAKEYLLGRMPLSLEESMGVAQFFGMRVLIKDEIVQPDQVVKKIKDVTMEEVKAICEELVKESEIRSVVVGPKQN
ncbi:MAG: hypothetical protein DPW11_04670 [bacterium]|nr:hypothetical protein [bacterium]